MLVEILILTRVATKVHLIQPGLLECLHVQFLLVYYRNNRNEHTYIHIEQLMFFSSHKVGKMGTTGMCLCWKKCGAKDLL